MNPTEVVLTIAGFVITGVPASIGLFLSTRTWKSEEVDRRADEIKDAFKRGRQSRDDEVALLKYQIQQAREAGRP